MANSPCNEHAQEDRPVKATEQHHTTQEQLNVEQELDDLVDSIATAQGQEVQVVDVWHHK